MCGIAGSFQLRGRITPDAVEAVRRMSNALVHRGPDDSGFLQTARVCLSHRRLSIIDLSEAGRQPLRNEYGNVAVICNGEIYNHRKLREELTARGHRFESASDSEVLVHGYEEWGLAALLGRLEGMYAFALHDARSESLFLARDRMGIKPLYYALEADENAVHFASEVHALCKGGVADGAADPLGLAGFLAFGSAPAPRTTVRGVRSLEAAHYAQFSAEGWEQIRYWDFGEPAAETERPMERALRAAVRRNLVSDVPVGIFLSAGVDSTALAILAREASADIRMVTVAIGNEESAAGETARQLSVPHTVLQPREQDFPQLLREFLSAMDQPTVDGLNTWIISRAAREAGLKVALSGAGGDEVFRGYGSYRRLRGLAQLPRIAGPLGALAGSALGKLAGREGWRRASWLNGGVSGSSVYGMLRGFYPLDDVQALTGLSDRELTSLREDTLPEEAGASLAAHYNRTEFRRYLHDQLLRDADVFSMAHGLEVRVPFLDTAVVNCAMRMADTEFTAGEGTKPALVNAVGHPRLAELAAQPKTGFHLPMARWMRANRAQLREHALRSSPLQSRPVREAWDRFEAGRLHWSRAMALVVIAEKFGRG